MQNTWMSLCELYVTRPMCDNRGNWGLTAGKGVWFVDIAGNLGYNSEYSEEERNRFRADPGELVKHSKEIENKINDLWAVFYKDSPEQAEGQKMLKARMAELIKDKRLLKGR